MLLFALALQAALQDGKCVQVRAAGDLNGGFFDEYVDVTVSKTDAIGGTPDEALLTFKCGGTAEGVARGLEDPDTWDLCGGKLQLCHPHAGQPAPSSESLQNHAGGVRLPADAVLASVKVSFPNDSIDAECVTPEGGRIPGGAGGDSYALPRTWALFFETCIVSCDDTTIVDECQTYVYGDDSPADMTIATFDLLPEAVRKQRHGLAEAPAGKPEAECE